MAVFDWFDWEIAGQARNDVMPAMTCGQTCV